MTTLITAALRSFANIDPVVSGVLRRHLSMLSQDLVQIFRTVYDDLAVTCAPVLTGEQRRQLAEAHHDHWLRLLSASFDTRYELSVRDLVALHHRHGLEVDVLLQASTRAVAAVDDLLTGRYGMMPTRRRTAVRALSKAMFVDAACMITAWEEWAASKGAGDASEEAQEPYSAQSPHMIDESMLWLDGGLEVSWVRFLDRVEAANVSVR